jgi:putative FmdB family regulatory protein
VPIYEYQCVSCNHRFELKQGFDAEPTESCPLCQAVSRRRFHSPAIIYRGSGFYTTDYARKDRPSDDGGSNSDGASDVASSDVASKEKEPSSKDD